MARKPRENVEGGVYHVYARGNAQGVIYRDDVDRYFYLGLLERVVHTHRWLCLAYCLMDNHVHLLLETPDADLSAGMQRLHGCYGQRFNGRHRRTGHVFQGRYGGIRMESDGQLCVAAAYIARNPIEAGLCTRPEEWRWSSYRAAARGAAPPWLAANRLLAFFGNGIESARETYARMTMSVS